MRGHEVVEIGRDQAPDGATDLGDVAILPGLVNAHTHLEFSDCRQPIGQPGIPLDQWIGQVVAARADTSPDSRAAAIAAGIDQSVAAGTRLIGEITTPPCCYPTEHGLLELTTFAEVLGLAPERSRERLEASIEHNRGNANGAWSPHAPYSTSLQTIVACIQLAGDSNRPIAMHVAESPAERELLCRGVGPFADALRRLGVWQDELFPWPDRPFHLLIEQLSMAPRALLIHGNDLRPDEIQQISKTPNVSVVYCPRTHAFFQYSPHPVGEMILSGIRVALGTDSRASNPDLSVWGEVQHLLAHRSDLDPGKIIRMATIDGADALGRSDLGRMEAGKMPGLGCVATSARDLDGVFDDFASNDYCPLTMNSPSS